MDDLLDQVEIRTSDSVVLSGLWQTGTLPYALLLLHMMPATKESWLPFMALAKKFGYAVLAIDLRGHGKSTMDGKLDYKSFSDEEHQASRLDVEAALSFLNSKGYGKEKVAVVGASIGANLALVTLGDYPDIKVAVGLSAGFDYKGILPLSSLKNLTKSQRALLCTSSEDTESFKSTERFEEASVRVEIRPLTDLGHGTHMFENKPDLMTDVLTWIQNSLTR